MLILRVNPTPLAGFRYSLGLLVRNFNFQGLSINFFVGCRLRGRFCFLFRIKVYNSVSEKEKLLTGITHYHEGGNVVIASNTHPLNFPLLFFFMKTFLHLGKAAFKSSIVAVNATLETKTATSS